MGASVGLRGHVVPGHIESRKPCLIVFRDGEIFPQSAQLGGHGRAYMFVGGAKLQSRAPIDEMIDSRPARARSSAFRRRLGGLKGLLKNARVAGDELPISEKADHQFGGLDLDRMGLCQFRRVARENRLVERSSVREHANLDQKLLAHGRRAVPNDGDQGMNPGDCAEIRTSLGGRGNGEDEKSESREFDHG